MKKSIIFLILIFLCRTFSVSQNICKERVKKLYEKVFERPNGSLQVGYRVYSCKALRFNKSKKYIYEAIDKGDVSTGFYSKNTISCVSIRMDGRRIDFYVSTIKNDSEPIKEIYAWDNVNIEQSTCRDCVRIFYEKLFRSSANNITINNDVCSRKSLLLNKSKECIYNAVKKAKVFSYGHPLDSVVALTIDKQRLYFCISTERPDIDPFVGVYDSNGRSLASERDYLLMPCVPKSKDGYVYVRKEKSATSKPVAKILKNQIFFFTPSQDSDWYRVSLTSDPKFVGYVHKSNILPYEKCTGAIRKKMEHIMFCIATPFDFFSENGGTDGFYVS